MKSRSLLFVFRFTVLVFLAGCGAEETVATITKPALSKSQANAQKQNRGNHISVTERVNVSCVRPAQADISACRQQEAMILAATIRIRMSSWTEFDDRMPISQGSVSHGTVVNGRYLITHNHFQALLTHQELDTSIFATLFNVDGDLILSRATFTVVFEDSETLLLDFGDKNDVGVFDSLGLSSVAALDWDSLPFTPVMEVAQLNWDGTTTYVEWVRIKEVIMDDNTPRIRLDNDIQSGSSGGGVFWQGHHVANNWLQVQKVVIRSGRVLQQSSLAALNSPKIRMVTTHRPILLD